MGCDDQRIFLKVEKNVVQGFLKTGMKKLFVTNEFGQMKEIDPVCVLDFYVHESMQRQGIGKQLLEKALEFYRVEPAKIAYDKPSNKLLGFLSKHYGTSSKTTIL